MRNVPDVIHKTHSPQRSCLHLPVAASFLPDTTSEDSHSRAEQPGGARRGSAVSNSAARVVGPFGPIGNNRHRNACASTKKRRPTEAGRRVYRGDETG